MSLYDCTMVSVKKLDLGRALLRGRYLCAVARIEASGVPLDGDLLQHLRTEWPSVIAQVIATVDSGFGVFRDWRLDAQDFSRLLDRLCINWPRTRDGDLDLEDTTFSEMARLHPILCPLKELRATLIGFDPAALSVGQDHRNRFPLRPFASSTGRNQPSSKASILAAPAWARRLIQPRPGTALAMLDWEQQEFGIAAALSEDSTMQAAYRSGDPYMALAIAAKSAPDGSSAATYAAVRERYKRCALGLQYGIGKRRLAQQLGVSEGVASAMIGSHKGAFSAFAKWQDAVENHALGQRELYSVFGWRLPIDASTNSRSIRNFPMQANGAEMLRLACCLLTEAGITVCAPNHDALLIEAPLAEIDDVVAEAQRMMAEASAVVLDGFELRTSVRVAKAPERWSEPRGQAIWSAVQSAIGTCSRV